MFLTKMYQHTSFGVLLISLLAIGSSALPASTPTLLPPSKDPFYTAPKDFESASPGDVLRMRPAPGNLTTVFSNTSAAYNILYRTTDSRFQPSWAVTTLFIPKKEIHGSPLLSYQIPYDSPNLDTSPSYALHIPVPPMFADDNDHIQTAISNGWLVNVPDYEGPLASFIEGIQSGHAVLDSVRAVLNSAMGAKTARYAMWGYSGGSFATEWAAELQLQYAPELAFAGAAMGGAVANFSTVLPAVNGTIWAGLAPNAIVGLVSQFPAAEQYMLSQLKEDGPLNKTGWLASKELTLEEALGFYGNQDIYAYFKNGEAFYQAPVIKELLFNQCQEGYHGIPQMPVFYYKAIQDEITHVAGRFTRDYNLSSV